MKGRYLILGVNGMAGHVIAQYLKEQGRNVIGFARTNSPVTDTIIGDALCKQDIENAVNSKNYDVIVNAIGILNKEVDKDEKKGRFINSELPHILADMLKERNTKLIHISTDCVFSGEKGNYSESSIKDAASLYGITKAAGEIIDDKNLTIRTSIVGPELKSNGIGLFHWFMTQKNIVYGYKNVIWSGVTTLQLAKSIYMDEEKNITGLVHLCNNTSINKFDLLNLFKNYCRTDSIEIKENLGVINDKSIVSTRKDIDFGVPDYEKMIEEMSGWIKKHPSLYKQYLQ